MAKLRVQLDELLPTKEASRTLPQALERLQRGEAAHLIITRRNKPRAVLLLLDRYEQLLEAERDQLSPHP
jgi:hypothetical protein